MFKLVEVLGNVRRLIFVIGTSDWRIGILLAEITFVDSGTGMLVRVIWAETILRFALYYMRATYSSSLKLGLSNFAIILCLVWNCCSLRVEFIIKIIRAIWL